MNFLDHESSLILDQTPIHPAVVDEDVAKIGARVSLGGLRAYGAKPQAFNSFGLAQPIGREELERVV